jgi:hypothetical protein
MSTHPPIRSACWKSSNRANRLLRSQRPPMIFRFTLSSSLRVESTLLGPMRSVSLRSVAWRSVSTPWMLTDFSPEDAMSSAPVALRMSFALEISSDVLQCTEGRMPPSLTRPSYHFASYSGMPIPTKRLPGRRLHSQCPARLLELSYSSLWQNLSIHYCRT